MQTQTIFARHRSLIIFSGIALAGLCAVNVRLAADLDRSLRISNGATSPSFYDPAPSRNASTSTEHLVAEHFRRAVGLELDDATRRRLPTWPQIEALIGKEPAFVGRERCEAFRRNVPPLRRMLGSSGMFNPGTNLVSRVQFWNI